MRTLLLAGIALIGSVAAGAGADGDLPILNEGEAPQIGHERVYGQTEIPVYRYKVLESFRHDPADYTEALFFHGGHLYEGTGRYGQSWIKVWDLESGTVHAKVALDDRYFGEGAIIADGRLIHLTYISNTGFTYDPETLERTGTFRYPFQGWGLTTDGESVIMSDGSSAVMFLDPDTLTVQRTIMVEDSFGSVGFLNELEYVDGEIYANVWQTDYIVRFSAETGAVTGWVDLTGLNPDPERLVYPLVLNGVAWDGTPGTLHVTGKQWPELWHIRLDRVQ